MLNGPFPTDVLDVRDGDNTDNSTAVGGKLLWTQTDVDDDSQLVGFSSSGDPVIYDEQGGVYYLLSDDATLSDGTNIGFTTSGTLFYCFAPGTMIATPDGERAVETLQISDPVLTADGQAVPVRWLGKQTVATRFLPTERGLVRIAAGALGDGLPHADLTVTGDHALLIEGVLCKASALVNDVTITRLSFAENGRTTHRLPHRNPDA